MSLVISKRKPISVAQNMILTKRPRSYEERERKKSGKEHAMQLFVPSALPTLLTLSAVVLNAFGAHASHIYFCSLDNWKHAKK